MSQALIALRDGFRANDGVGGIALTLAYRLDISLFGRVVLAQDVRLQYFFLPLVLRVQSNPGGEFVVIDRPTFLGTIEFCRIPQDVAFQLADFLETGVRHASEKPAVSGLIGEIHGTSVRRLGTGMVRIRVSVKRSLAIRFAVRETFRGLGRNSYHSRPKLSIEEAARFAVILRQANLPLDGEMLVG